MFKVVFVLACVALLETANALKCYSCNKDTCSNEMSTWENSKCSAATDPLVAACLTHTYKDATSQKEFTVRKCIQYDKKETYKCNPDLGAQVKCDVCTEDLCNKNSAARVSVSFVAISGILLAVLAPKFYL